MVVVGLNGFIAGYKIGILTTIEKRYNLNSAQLGTISSMYQVGPPVTMLFCGYLCGRPNAHRPRWISVGTLVVAAGLFISILPHLTLGPYEYIHETVTEQIINIHLCSNNSGNDLANETTSSTSEDTVNVQQSYVAYLYFVFGALMTGAGYSPISILGNSFIDDFAKHTTSALYLGLVNMMWGFGPIIGLVAAGASAYVYIDINRNNMDTADLKPMTSSWLGAWWLGIVIVIPFMVLVAFPFFMIPKHLTRNCEVRRYQITNKNNKERREKKSIPSVQAFMTTLKDVLQTLYNLMMNPQFMLVTVVFAIDLGIGIALGAFTPKFIQEEFYMTPLVANLTAGIGLGIAYGIGACLGGYIIKWFKIIQEDALTKFMMIAIGVSGILSLAYLFGCSGVTNNKGYAERIQK
uniref:Solute carrier organic anion transporter family member 2A1-like n=1 Tax=Saccoglossus kowalevskii TaxID=10224 RepID=A0ABM0M8L3_SACKO|nr:PREDICTED: solute carrier organic anion transporter family member 2A1-like [Saccoglossus kowalevskii]